MYRINLTSFKWNIFTYFTGKKPPESFHNSCEMICEIQHTLLTFMCVRLWNMNIIYDV